MNPLTQRTFLVKDVPSRLPLVTPILVKESYLSQADRGIQLKKISSFQKETVFLQVPNEQGEDMSVEIPQEAYPILLSSSVPLMYLEYEVQVENETWRVQVYRNLPVMLIMVVVPFLSQEKAELFQAPEWFEKEITFDERFCTHTLWRSLQ